MAEDAPMGRTRKLTVAEVDGGEDVCGNGNVRRDSPAVVSILRGCAGRKAMDDAWIP